LPMPDLSTVCDSLNILQTEAKASSDNAARMLEAVKHELKNKLKNTADTINAIAANVQLNIRAREAAKTAAKEAVEVGKANLQIARQIKNAGLPTGSALSYAVIVARGVPLASITNAQVTRMPPMQTQRKVIVTIRDPTIVLSLQVINLRNLNIYIERANVPYRQVAQQASRSLLLRLHYTLIHYTPEHHTLHLIRL
jgi:hypothetical protein